jgi:hypothetical protein
MDFEAHAAMVAFNFNDVCIHVGTRDLG